MNTGLVSLIVYVVILSVAAFLMGLNIRQQRAQIKELKSDIKIERKNYEDSLVRKEGEHNKLIELIKYLDSFSKLVGYPQNYPSVKKYYENIEQQKKNKEAEKNLMFFSEALDKIETAKIKGEKSIYFDCPVRVVEMLEQNGYKIGYCICEGRVNISWPARSSI